MTLSQNVYGQSHENGRSMNERELNDNTCGIAEGENEINVTTDPNSRNYSVNTNMRNSMPVMNQTNDDEQCQEYFNQWAQSLNQ